jgi:hypothetical protein
MRHERTLTEPESVRRVEALLRAAADFEPESPAPEGLEARMLARAHCRPPRTRLLLAAGAATALLALAALLPRGGHRGKTPPEPARLAQATAHPAPDAAAPAAAPRKSADPPGAHARKHSPSKGKERPDRPGRRKGRPESPPRPPRVRWRDQTIRMYASGIIAPAWMAEETPEGDSIVLTPVVMDIPAHREERMQPAGHSDNNNYLLVSTLEENR